MTAVWGALVALAIVVGLLGLLVVGLLRSHAAILKQLEQLGAGLGDDHRHGEEDHRLELGPSRSARSGVPDIAGLSPDGEPLVVSTTVGTDPTLVAFLSTSCSSCTVFWEGLDQDAMAFGDRRHRVVIATLGEDEESPTRAQALARGSADVVMSSAAWSDFQVPGAPYFVLLDPSRGVIGEGSASTFEALERFLSDAANDRRWDERRANKSRADAEREARVDDELRAAGIEPGDQRLYPRPGEIEGGGS